MFFERAFGSDLFVDEGVNDAQFLSCIVHACEMTVCALENLARA